MTKLPEETTSSPEVDREEQPININNQVIFDSDQEEKSISLAISENNNSNNSNDNNDMKKPTASTTVSSSTITTTNASSPLPTASSPLPSVLPPPPNGGLTAWLQVVGCFFCMFNSFGVVNSFGAFQAFYSEDLLRNESDSAISWIGSIQGFIIVAPGLITGRLFDAGYGRQMVWTGTILVSFGYMMTSLATSYYQVLLAQGICVGLGCNLLFMPGVAFVSQYFTTRRATAIVIGASGSSLGGVIYPIMVQRLLTEVGYPWTTRILGFTVLGLNTIPCIFMKHRLPPRRSGPLIDIPSLTDVTFLFYSLGSLFGFFSIYVPIFYIPSFTISLGHSTATALYMSSVINAASIFGRLIPNIIADKIGPFNTLIPSALVVMVLCFAWISVKSLGGVIVFGIFFGFFSGTYVSLPPSCVASMTKDMSKIGTRMGMSFFLASFGIIGGAPAAGSLLRADHGDYKSMEIFAGIALALSVACLSISRYLIKGFAPVKV